MAATWFIGDTHFGHEKVSSIRGFSATDAHDEKLMWQWKRQVKDGDLVYVLGDISSGSRQPELRALDILESLPGRKRLIAGNHDSVASIHRTLSPHLKRFNEVFERIGDFGRIRLERREVLLSHYPYVGDHTDKPRYSQYRLPDLGLPLIHAHTHSTTRFAGREACVSWDAWNRMVNLGDLRDWILAEGVVMSE
jgi:calcineurin-like phosphoesterase family protein